MSGRRVDVIKTILTALVYAFALTYIAMLAGAEVHAEIVKARVTGGTFESQPNDHDYLCDGVMAYQWGDVFSMEYGILQCEERFNLSFETPPVNPIPFSAAGLKAKITHLKGSSTSLLEMIIGPVIKPPPSDKFCAFGAENDPGTGVYLPSPECHDLTIYDGSASTDTRITACVDKPNTLPTQCGFGRSVVGHEIFAQRLVMPDLGDKKELFSMIQTTTINTMIGPALTSYKNVITSFSEIPGDFEPDNSRCANLNASENTSVFIIQQDSDESLENPGRYCTFEPNKRYYVNSRFDRGLSENCGKLVGGVSVHCSFDVVLRLTD